MGKSTLVFLVVLCVVWFGVCTGAIAGPEITVVIPDELNIGSIPYPGEHILGCPFVVHVVSPDIGYAVDFSFSPFVHQNGSIIPLSRTILSTPQINRPPTPLLGEDQDINLQFAITTESTDAPGNYMGKLMITVMPW